MSHDGPSLNRLSVSATLHCTTGCIIGEIAGLVIGTALGWSDLATIALAIGLAFLFGYTLTSLPLFRAGLTLGAIIPIALATDTVSITIMEAIESATMLVFPGAMDAGSETSRSGARWRSASRSRSRSPSSRTATSCSGARATPSCTSTTSTGSGGSRRPGGGPESRRRGVRVTTSFRGRPSAPPAWA
jgi:hypothetical protein